MIGPFISLGAAARCALRASTAGVVAAGASSRPLVVQVGASREICLYLILLEATAAGSMELALLR